MNYINYIVVFIIAFISSLLLTLIAEKIVIRIGLIIHPRERDVHEESTPTLGGLAIFAAFMLSLFVIIYFFGLRITHIKGIFIGSCIIILFGILDDLFEVKPWVKFIGQVIAVTVLIIFGVKIGMIRNPFDGMIVLGWIGIIITYLWVAGLSNAVNYLDGLDGLAAGVTAIATLALFFFALITLKTESGVLTERIEAATLSIALCGASLGFLPRNFNPAKIFMGDTGALFLGFILGIITIQGALKSFAALTFLVPIIILAIPIFDATFVSFRRVKNKASPARPDMGHIHHRLLNRGYNQRQTVIILYLWSIVLCIIAFVMNFTNLIFALIAFILLAGITAVIIRKLKFFQI